MDQASKIFVLVLIGSLIAGALVVLTNRDYRPEKILASNEHYYPDFKPAPAAEPPRP
jgi:acyl-CoA synthetase (AMP-forming)/AMP-acid ligase II